MKKLSCLLICIFALMLSLTSCDMIVDKLPDGLVDKIPFLKGDDHEHTFSAEWSSDDENHWYAASCEHTEEKKDLAPHTDAGNDGVCDVCAKAYYTPETPEEPDNTKPDTPTPPHEHTFSTEWSSDGEDHWHAATCEHKEVIKDLAAHTDDGNDGVCDVCDKTYYTPIPPHEHSFSTEWTSDGTNHWHAAICEHTEETKDLAPHADAGNDGVCDVCDKTYYTPIPPHKHSFSTEWSSDEENHWYAATCEHTEEKKDLAPHADAGNDGVCDACGKTYYTPVIPEPHRHVYSKEWTSDGTNHWHAAICEHTDEIADLAPHTDAGNDGICDTCSKNYYTPHRHSFSEEWSSDEVNHWHAASCEHTEEIADLAPHTDAENDGVCDTCKKSYYTPVIALTTGQMTVNVLGDAVKARFTANGNGTYALNITGTENAKIYVVKGDTEVLVDGTYETSLSAGETVTFMIYRDSVQTSTASVMMTIYKKSGVPVTPEVDL